METETRMTPDEELFVWALSEEGARRIVGRRLPKDAPCRIVPPEEEGSRDGLRPEALCFAFRPQD